MKKILLITLICSISNSVVFAQQDPLFSSTNLLLFKAEGLTDPQLNSIMLEMKKRSLTINDLERYVIGKGMPQEQFSLLAEKLKQKSTQSSVKGGNQSQNHNLKTNNANELVVSDLNGNEQIDSVIREPKSLIFGSELFLNKQMRFEPNQSLATPPTYVVGPGDQLQIIIFGVQQLAEDVIVNKEGMISISNVGNIRVGGIQFAALVELLTKKCGSIYSSLRTGASKINVSVISFKTIQVTLVGVKNPGNYAVSSLATVYNALHAGGGPDENGSYRFIELIRNGKVIKTIDLYSFLCKGDVSNNLNLQNDDIIRVPPYTNRVQIMGEIKTPGIFELKNQETFKDLLSYCSGFKENSYTDKILITRISNKERKLITLEKVFMDTFRLVSGDFIQVDSVLNTFENRISITGAVHRPGFYELIPEMKISELINLADGVTDDAHLTRALLIRQRDDLRKEIIGVNLKEIVSNSKSISNLLLKKEDQLIVPSFLEFEEESFIDISGEILKPGKYPYIRNLSLYDIIVQAGGMKESSNGIIEISRIIKNDSIAKQNEAEIISINLNNGLQSEINNIMVKPHDIISVKKNPTYKSVSSLVVEGEVLYPGRYGIGKKNEKISEIISRAGGLNDLANINGVKIIRELEFVDDLDSMKVKIKKITIPINYQSITKNAKSKSNISVREGDRIVVERLIQTVSVTGEVELTSEIPLFRGKRARYYINAAGGFKEEALKKRVYVVYANGIAKKTKSFLFFRFYPKPDFGSQVVVTKRPEENKRLTSSEIIGISGMLTSITGMTIALIRLFQ